MLSDEAGDDVFLIKSEVHPEHSFPTEKGTFYTSLYRFKCPKATELQNRYLHRLCETISSAGRGSALYRQVEGQITAEGDLPVLKAAILNLPALQAGSIAIRHQAVTELEDVGLQVWKGAFLLCDLALSLGARLSGLSCLELGCGTGLTGICLSMLCQEVFMTDLGHHQLVNCEKNVQLNVQSTRMCHIRVKELDWEEPLSEVGSAALQDEDRHAWSAQDLDDLSRVQLLWAADVIYDEDLTALFLGMAYQLLARCQSTGSKPLLFMSAEKRFNFAMGDSSPRAHEFDSFLRLLEELSWSDKDMSHKLRASELDAELIPQWFEYQRSKDLVLFAIRLEAQS